MTGVRDVLDFWLEETGPAGWFNGDEALDTRCRTRFLDAWCDLLAGGLRDWCRTAEGALAYVILSDQFPRNMFRGSPRAFETDSLAREAARRAIARGDDLATPVPVRAFFYLPFEHAEDMTDQDWSVVLAEERLGDAAPDMVHHARLHREMIARFGRFPFRNRALGRVSTAAEEAFFAAGGYGALVRTSKK